MNFTYPPDATPIDPNDEIDLIPVHLTTQAELNEAEHDNILKSRIWSRRRRHSDLLTVAFAERLHRRMFDDVWKWAGERRKVELQNKVFLPPYLLEIELRTLFDNTSYRITNAKPNTAAEWDRFAAEFHHRLVKIHYFRNGNGRHAREMTDLLLIQNGQPSFTWGGASLTKQSEVRSQYIAALRKADENDYSALLEFARS
jgi:Fic-DOC domain mobile mystery protein B